MTMLKPCPFCGCEYGKDDDDLWWAGNHADWCPLSAEGGFHGNLIIPDDEEYIEAWNRRAGETSGLDRPLSDAELRGMDGQAVWLSHLEDGFEDFDPGFYTGWHTVNVKKEKLYDAEGRYYDFHGNGVVGGFHAYLRQQEKEEAEDVHT